MSFYQWRGRTSDASTSGIDSGAVTSVENSPDIIPGTPESSDQDFSNTPRSHWHGLLKPRPLRSERDGSKGSSSDKVHIPESDDEILEDSGCENKGVVESEGEIISDSEEEGLPNLKELLKPASDSKKNYLLPSSVCASASSPPKGKMFDHLKASGRSQNGRLLSSTPTLDTSDWRSSSKAAADSDSDEDSPIFTGKRSKTRCLIESGESLDESESDVCEYSRSGKKCSPDNSDNSSQEDSEVDYSESPLPNRIRKKEPHSEILDESDFSIPQYTSAHQKGKGKISLQHDTESQESKSHNVADSSGSLDESPPVPVIKKKLFNRIESDDEEAYIASLKFGTPPGHSQTEICEDSFQSVSSEGMEKVTRGASIEIGKTVTPVSSPEKDKALTPQEKYGHKFKIKKKSPQIKENSPNSSNSPIGISEVQKTPQKDNILNESVRNLSTSYYSPSPNKNNSKLAVVSAGNRSLQSSFVVADLTSSEMKMKLKEKKKLLKTTNLSALPDGGSKIKNQIEELEAALANLSVASIEGETSIQSETSVFSKAHSPVANISYVTSPPAKNKSESSIIVVESPQIPTSPTLKELERKLEKKKIRYSRADLGSLPDGGMKMRKKMLLLEQEIARRKGSLSEMYRFDVDQGKTSKVDTEVKASSAEPLGELESKKKKLEELKMVYRAANPRSLPDGGARLKERITLLEKDIMMLQLREKIELKTTQPDIITVEGPKMHYKQSKLTDYGLESAVVSASKDSQRNRAAFDMDAMYDIAMDYGARNYGGKISSKREREMIRVTAEAVQELHDALESAPNVDEVEEEDPDKLLVPLMPHQRKALAWLLWRESQLPRGGILADDMGLGKTLTMISLILKHRELVKGGKISEDFEGLNDSSQESGPEPEQNSDEEKWIQKKNYIGLPKRKKLVPSKGTLVVCPASLLGQWEGEVKKRVAKGNLKTLVYHGTNREYDIRALAHFDIVVTTYQLVMKEAFPSGKDYEKGSKDDVPKIKAKNQGRLFQVGWARIILDEAHQIRNHKSKTSQATCLLRGGRRWVLTGTPVQNKEMDLYSLIRFLRIKPFDDYTCWKLQVSNNSAQGMRRLSLIVKALMLRRTKDQIDQQTGKQLVELPEKKIVQHTLNLTQREREVYDRIFQFSRSTMTHYMKSQEEKEQEKLLKWGEKGSSNYRRPDDHKYTPTLPAAAEGMTGEVKAHHLLILLLRLRQICSHPSLIKGMVETDTESDGIDPADNEGVELDIVSQMAEMSLRSTNDIGEEADAKVKKNVLTMDNPIFQRSSRSSKVESVIEELQKIRQEGTREKSVIVSQWTTMLEVVREHLREAGIRCHTISGQVQVKDRTSIVEDFNTNPKGPKVMLLSLAAGGVGLNLVGANHLFLLDMHWNPQLEAQACDRIYRVGQTRPVTVHRFVIQNTVEERILELQQKKLQLADEVLSGVKRTAQNKLTLEDMKALFNIGGNNAPVMHPA